jgi:prepilin-type processing-associated H-X9-DG protein
MRELSRRLVCGANMRGISACMTIYGSELESLRADPFRALLDSGEITARQFVCPSSGKTVQDVEKDPYACYVPVVYDMPGAESWNISSATILLYERDNHGGQGGNVVYADGHAEFIRPYSEMLRRVEESKRRSATSQPAADGSGRESN